LEWLVLFFPFFGSGVLDFWHSVLLMIYFGNHVCGRPPRAGILVFLCSQKSPPPSLQRSPVFLFYSELGFILLFFGGELPSFCAQNLAAIPRTADSRNHNPLRVEPTPPVWTRRLKPLHRQSQYSPQDGAPWPKPSRHSDALHDAPPSIPYARLTVLEIPWFFSYCLLGGTTLKSVCFRTIALAFV